MVKTKAANPPGITEADALKAMSLMATANAKLTKLNGDKKTKVLALDEKYGTAIADLEKAKTNAESIVLKFLEENREAFLAGAKSKKFGPGTIGVRVGNNKLILAAEGVEWSDVVKLVKEKLPDYIREDWVLQKDKLLSDFGGDPEANEKLLEVGVAIVQEEKLFVKI